MKPQEETQGDFATLGLVKDFTGYDTQLRRAVVPPLLTVGVLVVPWTHTGYSVTVSRRLEHHDGSFTKPEAGATPFHISC